MESSDPTLYSVLHLHSIAESVSSNMLTAVNEEVCYTLFSCLLRVKKELPTLVTVVVFSCKFVSVFYLL
ncbi:hypothetical protein VNO80_10508 [Phaseolus coccineus]|uniref:Uncharacterized protein n=1 Tax=Phaseolus coccineus TaxID=3886 RepID=A0AAN9NDJ4_PHACN